MDPTDREELVMDGSVTFIMNAHKEVCGVHKLGGAPMHREALMTCARVASVQAEQLVRILEKAVAVAEREYQHQLREDHAAAAGYSKQKLGTVDLTSVVTARQGITDFLKASSALIRDTFKHELPEDESGLAEADETSGTSLASMFNENVIGSTNAVLAARPPAMEEEVGHEVLSAAARQEFDSLIQSLSADLQIGQEEGDAKPLDTAESPKVVEASAKTHRSVTAKTEPTPAPASLAAAVKAPRRKKGAKNQ